MWTKKFWKDTAERVIASIAGGVLAAGSFAEVGVIGADWLGVLSIGLGTGLVSLLKALVAANKGDHESASLAD